jgi:hypothetical protein
MREAPQKTLPVDLDTKAVIQGYDFESDSFPPSIRVDVEGFPHSQSTNLPLAIVKMCTKETRKTTLLSNILRDDRIMIFTELVVDFPRTREIMTFPS